MRRSVVETKRDRLMLIRDAGFSRVSKLSVLAGTVVAYGTFVVLISGITGLMAVLGVDGHLDSLSANDWRRLGAIGSAIAAFSMFVSWLFGGYVSGRMSRRAGVLHGFLSFVLGIFIVAGLGALISTQLATDQVLDNLRTVGIPTSGDEWAAIGTLAGIGTLLGMLLGSLAGGALGERWHAKLLTRAIDPDVGAAAEARERAEKNYAEARDGFVAAGTVRESAIDRVRLARGRRTHADGDGDGTIDVTERADTDATTTRTDTGKRTTV